MATKKRLASLVIIAILVISTLSTVSYIKKVGQAYVFVYPLVLMDLTRQVMTEEGDDPFPSNSLYHVSEFPDHTFRSVVRPNVDTLYTIAWIDLKKEPVIIKTPNTQGRYYVLPFMDAWTNVFASVGKRTHGTQANTIMIVGPDWNGITSQDIEVIKAPTNMVWMIGRIQTNGIADVENVKKLQTGFELSLLSEAETNRFKVANEATTETKKADLNEKIKGYSAPQFFNKASMLIAEQAPAPADQAAIELLADIGVKVGKPFGQDINFIQSFLMETAVQLTFKKITGELESRKGADNGWTVVRDKIGNYATNYGLRAGVALVGLGALPPEEAVYPNTNIDKDNRILHGTNQYRIHFPADELPPVDAFWSLTMYDQAGYLINNSIKRYAIGDRDNLIFNDDGSVDIWIQNQAPKGKENNWLPAPQGEFALTMRLYLPKNNVRDGSWPLPDIEKI